jgi:hypothetical protein
MVTYRELRDEVSLNLSLHGDELSASRYDRFTSREIILIIHLKEDCVDPKAFLDVLAHITNFY